MNLCLSVYFDFRHQVFQIKVRDGNQIEKLKELSNILKLVSFALFPHFGTCQFPPEHPVNVVVPPASLELVKSFLESHGLEYSVSIKDLQALFDKQIKEMKFNRRKAKRDTNFNYGDYHSLTELYREMANIASEYPRVAKRLKIGNSFEKRPLYVLKFSTGKNKRPAIWLNHGIHAREWITQATGIWIARKIASDFSKNKPTITSILNKMDIFLMPVANPDGYVYSRTKNRSWRKNRSHKRFKKCVGVDLNRNWDVAFSKGTTSDDPCSEKYHGPNPHSEVEVQSVANFILNHGNFKSFIDIHSFSQLLMYPYGYINSMCPDCDELVSAPSPISDTQEILKPSVTIDLPIYIVSGNTIDWAYKNGIKYAFTFELRDNGTYGFELPADQIIPTALEIWLALEVIMVHVKDHLY
uniref:Peptidase M14 domain-containing protein n=1 Tax=Sarcophilus harrisii TaxID=9305 RepID=G3VNJ2_SARHA